VAAAAIAYRRLPVWVIRRGGLTLCYAALNSHFEGLFFLLIAVESMEIVWSPTGARLCHCMDPLAGISLANPCTPEGNPLRSVWSSLSERPGE